MYDPLTGSRPGGTASLPQERIVQKLDEYMSRNDYAGAERHLLYWYDESVALGDERARLMILSELIGHFRKTGQKERAFDCIDKAMALIGEISFEGTISAATAYVNAATASSAFGENERAVELFGKAQKIYESSPGTDPHLKGGLYNNMALSLCALGRFEEAEEMYRKAYDTMASLPDGRPEMAITCLNEADMIAARDGMEAGEKEIFRLLDEAGELLDDPGIPKEGYYAFVCEKCAPTFSYYGYFAQADKYEKTAQEIYSANRHRED